MVACASQNDDTTEAFIKINEPHTIQLKLLAGTNTSDAPFTLPEVNGGRLQVQLRTTANETQATLHDPGGRVRASSDDDGSVFRPRAELARADLGDLLLLPEQANPAAGRWQLRITYRPQDTEQFALVTVSVFARLSLNLVSNLQTTTIGTPIILTTLAMDKGIPVSGLSPQIVVNSKVDAATAMLDASESATSPAGIRLTNEPGVYLAVFTPTAAGAYAFCTHARFPDGTELRSNCVDVTVQHRR